MNEKELLKQIIYRQNAMLDMMSEFVKAYAKVNNLAIEDVREECEYINANEGHND